MQGMLPLLAARTFRETSHAERASNQRYNLHTRVIITKSIGRRFNSLAKSVHDTHVVHRAPSAC
eukprot:4210393-Amphidinium_carterae.1